MENQTIITLAMAAASLPGVDAARDRSCTQAAGGNALASTGAFGKAPFGVIDPRPRGHLVT